MEKSSKNFYIQRNWVGFLCRDFYKLAPNSPCAIQIGKLYNKFTHLTFQWYFHLIFGRILHDAIVPYRLSRVLWGWTHKNCNLSNLITMNSIHWNLSFLELISFKNWRKFKIYDIVKCLNKWYVHITNILNSWNLELDLDQKFWNVQINEIKNSKSTY